MKQLEKDLEKLKSLIQDKVEFKKQYDSLCENYPDMVNVIDDFVRLMVEEFVKETKETLHELSIKMQLGESFEYLPLAYIARTYFKKSRGWLYQRLKGNIVNGKPAKFTPEQINTLNLAFKDLGNKITSIKV